MEWNNTTDPAPQSLHAGNKRIPLIIREKTPLTAAHGRLVNGVCSVDIIDVDQHKAQEVDYCHRGERRSRARVYICSFKLTGLRIFLAHCLHLVVSSARSFSDKLNGSASPSETPLEDSKAWANISR